MHVVLLTHEPFYPPSGGGSSQAWYVSVELARRGHRVTVFCPASPGNRSVHVDGLSIEEFTGWRMSRNCRGRMLKYAAYPWALARQVARFIANQPCDMVLAQHTISSVAAGRLSRRGGPPFVMNLLDCLTGYLELWPAWTGAPIWARWLTRWELDLPGSYSPAGVFTISDVLKDELVRRGFAANRILPSYFGFDDAVFRPPADEAPSADPPLVLMHGSFDHHHLGPIARDAMVEVLRVRPDVRFRFVGPVTSALQNTVAAVRRTQPGAHITCTGFVPYVEVGAHLRETTVGMIPYAPCTGSHMTVVSKAIEFAASGVPVACTALDGTKRFFRDEPLVRFSEFTGAALGGVILGWINEPYGRRRTLGLEASRRIREILAWGRIGVRMADFIEECATRACGKEPRRSGSP